MSQIQWTSGTWLHEPPAHSVNGSTLVITTADQSDFWRSTGYGFNHDSGHALLSAFAPDTAMEVEFSASWSHAFDQAGIMMHADESHWIKAGLELADGVLGLGAVVTHERSDWSVGHVPDWLGASIRVRISRTRDAVTIRARTDRDPWRLVRLAPIDPDRQWRAGPFAASPSRAGLTVSFYSWTAVTPDEAIHHESE